MVYVYISHYLLRNVIQVHRIVYQLNLYVQIQLVRTPVVWATMRHRFYPRSCEYDGMSGLMA